MATADLIKRVAALEQDSTVQADSRVYVLDVEEKPPERARVVVIVPRKAALPE